MAYALPLCERSGVNLKGLTAASKLTIADGPEDFDETGADAAGGAAGAAGASGASGASGGGEADFGFYTSFWGLQKVYFALPLTPFFPYVAPHPPYISPIYSFLRPLPTLRA